MMESWGQGHVMDGTKKIILNPYRSGLILEVYRECLCSLLGSMDGKMKEIFSGIREGSTATRVDEWPN